MASEFALAVAQRNKETTQTVGALRLANDVDSELQEVRKVVKLISQPKFDVLNGSLRYYVTKAEVQRARELMKRLEVK